MRVVPVKGRAVFATQLIPKGKPFLEYTGELISAKEGNMRDADYQNHRPEVKPFLFFFKHDGHQYCIDATNEPDDRLGKLINHSKKRPNLTPNRIAFGGEPKIVFHASRDIQAGEELLFDYGDDRKDVIESNPWLKD